MTAIGSSVSRVEGREKVLGAAQYAADYLPEGCVHAVIVGAPAASGQLTALDTTRAGEAPGVVAIFTHETLPSVSGKTKLVPSLAGGPAHGQSFFPMQDTTIHYHGQPIALVVAETLEQAEAAAALIDATVDGADAVSVLDQGRETAYDASRIFGGFVSGSSMRGDVDAALAAAAHQVQGDYHLAANHHNPIECSATTAVWDGDTVTIYESTQGISATQMTLAEVLGLAQSKARMVGGLLTRGVLSKLLDRSSPDVRVIGRFVGGGFGSKAMVWPHTSLAALAARTVDRPVKLSLTRAQMFTSCGHREEQEQSITVGADATGRITAIRHHKLSLTSQFDDWAELSLDSPGKTYRVENYDGRYRLIKGNTMTPTFTRSPGESGGMFVLETALDELAEQLRVDPVELRLRNAADHDPTDGSAYSSTGLRECLQRGADLFGWADRPGVAARTEGDLRIGYGMATAVYPVYKAMRSQRARVRLTPTGFVVEIGTQEFGTGGATIAVQVAADALGVDHEEVAIRYGDTTLPVSTAQVGSAGAGAISASVDAAAANLRHELLRRAGLDADAVVRDGRLPDGRTYADVLAESGDTEIAADGVWDPPRPSVGKMDAGLTFGAQFVEVAVDVDLGLPRVRRMLGVFAPGRVLNSKTARSQLTGGMIWGMSQALFEGSVMDARTGRWANASLGEYLVPVHADIPDVRVEFVDVTDAAVNPMGVKGVGEIGQVGVAAAIANAIHNATGKRIRTLPMTVELLR